MPARQKGQQMWARRGRPARAGGEAAGGEATVSGSQGQGEECPSACDPMVASRACLSAGA